MVTTESFKYDKNLLLSFSLFCFLRRDGYGILGDWLTGVVGEDDAWGGCSGGSLYACPSSPEGVFGSVVLDL